MTEYELELGNNASLVGMISVYGGEAELEDLAVIAWIDGCDYDVTSALPPKRLAAFHERFMREFAHRALEDAVSFADARR